MSEKLTKHQIKSWKKGKEKQEQRLRLKDQRRQRPDRLNFKRNRPSRQPLGSDYDDGEYTVERSPRARSERPPAAIPADYLAQPIGTVIEVRSGDSLVSCTGQTLRALLPLHNRSLGSDERSPIAVGDQVRLQPVSDDTARIVAILPRRTALSRDVYDPTRRAPSHKRQVLAANIDQVIIVCSPAEPPFRSRLIDRYLVAASLDSLPAIICLNKADLGIADATAASLQGYAALGVQVVYVSALTGQGIDALREAVAGKVSLFTGHSGVGKSSLLNTLEPGLTLRVGEVTQSTAGQGKGRHTTTAARLIPLSLPDTFVVDTPGIRAFGVLRIASRYLAEHFPDIKAHASGCSLRACLHRGEPGCAVVAAAQQDAFLRQRMESYRALLKELKM